MANAGDRINQKSDGMGLTDENKRMISWCYREWKKEFLSWLGKCYEELSREDVEDAYQEAFVALCENVASGKYEKRASCSLKTYLFQIGINKTIDRLREKGRDIDVPRLEDLLFDVSGRDERVYDVVARMSSPSPDTLSAFHGDRFSLQEIACQLEYKDAAVVKSQKYRCMRKVADLLRKMGIVNQ